MTQVTLLKDFTKAIVSIEGEDIDVEELGDLPLSIVVNGKVRNIEKIELRKYVFTVPDDEGLQLLDMPICGPHCVPSTLWDLRPCLVWDDLLIHQVD